MAKVEKITFKEFYYNYPLKRIKYAMWINDKENNGDSFKTWGEEKEFKDVLEKLKEYNRTHKHVSSNK